MKEKFVVKGSGCPLLCLLKNLAGNPYGTGSNITLTLKRDFGDYGTVDTSTADKTLYDPVRGTTDNPDSRWNPGVDGMEGFNAAVLIKAAHLSAVGVYLADVSIGEARQIFKIHVGSAN